MQTRFASPSPDRFRSQSSILLGPLCQGLDVGVLAGTWCGFAEPVNRSLRLAAHGTVPQLSLGSWLAALLGAAVLYIAWRLIFHLAGVYRPLGSEPQPVVWYALRCLIALNGSAAAAAGALLVFGTNEFWSRLAGYWFMSLGLLLSVRLVLLCIAPGGRRPLRLLSPRRLLVAGAGERAHEVLRATGMRPSKYRIVGFLQAAPGDLAVPESQVVGGLDDLKSLLQTHTVDEVVVALPLDGLYERVGRLVADCREFGVEVRASADLLAEVKAAKRLRSATRARSGARAGGSPGWIRRTLMLHRG